MVDEKLTFDKFCMIVTLFEKLVGFNSASISQKDLLTKVSESN